MRVGFVGWRGMVGSVLLQRMLEEHDFDLLDVEFFSASRAGAAAFKGFDAIVTCQGSDWTNAMHAPIRAAGFNGYWIDAANALRMSDDAVIILDPVNRDVIDAALARGTQNFIGS